MKVAISGSTGFIGSRLSNELANQGWEIVPLTRCDFARDDANFAKKISGCNVIINLAGAPIMKRWTESYKKTILLSRIAPTLKITNAIHSLSEKPELFISASATGIYDSNGIWDEMNFSFSNDFLAEVCQAWETDAMLISGECRTVIVRFGIVLDKKEGALAKMLPIFRMGFGGPMGSGKQGFSWIHIKDLIGALLFLIKTKEISGPVNLVAPEFSDNKTYSKILAKTLHRPSLFKVPEFALKLFFGNGAEVLTTGQKVLPKKLIDSGYRFKFPDLAGALKAILK